MQPHGQNPVRPVALQGQTELAQLFDLVRAQQQGNRSAFSSIPTQQPILPEFSLYHAAHLSGLLGNSNTGGPLQPDANLAPVGLHLNVHSPQTGPSTGKTEKVLETDKAGLDTLMC